MVAETTVKITFPELDDARAHEEAQSLFSEIKQDHEVHTALNLNKSAVARTNKESMDFGATLIVVLGTPAVIILAKTIKSWVERTGRTSITINGVRIDNVHSRDVAAIVNAIDKRPPA